jgi:hypothetical protein
MAAKASGMNSFDAFDSFLAELQAADPDLDIAPLETVLHNIAYQPDDFALNLFGPVRWIVRQTKYPPLVRLAYIEHLLTSAIEGPPQLLH